jgi:hypothetical protein
VHQQNVPYALSSHFAMLSLGIDLLAFEDYTTYKLIHRQPHPSHSPVCIYTTPLPPLPHCINKQKPKVTELFK